MIFQGALSLCIFILFVVIIWIRAIMLKKHGINVIVFGKTDRKEFIYLLLIMVIGFSLLMVIFGLPLWLYMVHPFWKSELPGWFGLLLYALSIIGFVVTLANFGKSFRVGIDEKQPDKLITGGVFTFSRNPVYLCFLVYFLGLLLIFRNVALIIVTIIAMIMIHRRILREESFLSSYYGQEYKEYCIKVRRYL